MKTSSIATYIIKWWYTENFNCYFFQTLYFLFLYNMFFFFVSFPENQNGMVYYLPEVMTGRNIRMRSCVILIWFWAEEKDRICQREREGKYKKKERIVLFLKLSYYLLSKL